MNPSLKITFLEDMIKLYDLKEYNNDYEPTIFYGLITDNDICTLEKNKSLKVIIWTGGDINYKINRSADLSVMFLKNIKRILKVPKIKHISISSFISKSLTDLNLPFKMVPIMGLNFNLYKPIIKGPCIYLYTSPSYSKYYGEELYVKLIKKYKNIKFIITCCKLAYQNCEKKLLNIENIPVNYYTKEQLLNNIYSQCFIGLRLTDHDGLSATVQELGLFGIKTVHNGCSPSSLNYKTFEDICFHIDKEIKTIGKIDIHTAIQVKKYLTVDQKFFNSNYHK